MACNGRLAIKDRLHRFGLIKQTSCCFYNREDTLHHLMLTCPSMQSIWKPVLQWLQISHMHLGCEDELSWIMNNRKGKVWKSKILKCAFAKTVYEAWRFRNQHCFGNKIDGVIIGPKVIDIIVFRCWTRPNLRSHISQFMLP
ncbi:unnamed protein product [Lathyrus oleraceus]